MAESFAHRWGQVVGNVLQASLCEVLQEVADRHGLYLDYQRIRAARTGKKVAWQDRHGNVHDLDYVLERGGTDDASGNEEQRQTMNRYHLLAAEIYGYSYANYEDHLGIGNLRYEKLMPNVARQLERAAAEGGAVEKVARKLKTDLEEAANLQRAFRMACEVVDAENAAESFRWGVRHAIERAVSAGLRDEVSMERLVTQVCYRATDLAFLLERERKSLSRYSRHLRREPGVEYGEGYFEEED